MPDRPALADPIVARAGRMVSRVAAWVRPHAKLDTRLGHHLAQVRAYLPDQPTPERIPDLLAAFARSYRSPTVLQIGANDGQDYDRLRRYIRRGRWRAWLLEPVPDIYLRLEAYTRFLKRVTALNLAVGPEDGTLPFYRITPATDGERAPAWYDKVGSFDRDVILSLEKLWPPIVDRIEETTVECVTIATLLDRFPIGVPDLVSIDAEGFDGEILRQLEAADLCPAVVIYEHAHLGEDESQTADRLRARGYELFVEGLDTFGIHQRALAQTSSPLARAFRETSA